MANDNLVPVGFCSVCSVNTFEQQTRASISQDYWGHKTGSWGSPGRGSGDEVPQKLKLFVKLRIIFALKTTNKTTVVAVTG